MIERIQQLPLRLIALTVGLTAFAFLAVPALAQESSQDIADLAWGIRLEEAKMAALQDYEHVLLREKDRLEATAAAMTDPIWVGTRFGNVGIHPGEITKRQIENRIFLGDLLGVSDFVMRDLPADALKLIGQAGQLLGLLDLAVGTDEMAAFAPWKELDEVREVAEYLRIEPEQVVDLAQDPSRLSGLVRDRLMGEVRAQSDHARRQILASLEDELRRTREQFDRALAERDRLRAAALAERGGGTGLSPGYYAVRVSGSGFIKRFGGVALRQTGSHVFMISVTERGGGVNIAAGRTFADLVAEWEADMTESSQRSCSSGPSVHPLRQTDPPHIWVSGRRYELLGGPASANEIRQRFGCDSSAGWRICLGWQSERLRYSDLPDDCR